MVISSKLLNLNIKGGGMAKKIVRKFIVEIQNNSVLVSIYTENIKPFVYEIFSDQNHPSLANIASHLENGLNNAKVNHRKIDISDFKERRYVHIVTPVESHCDKYTADRL